MIIRDKFLIINVLLQEPNHSYLIHFCGFFVPLPHFIGQPLWFKHFQPRTTKYQLSFEFLVIHVELSLL